jgi:hypothetical protein
MFLLNAPRAYVYPPRAVDAIPREATGIWAKMGWLAQLKYNDTHLLIDMEVKNGGINELGLWNRHKSPINLAQTGTYTQTILVPELSHLAAMFMADPDGGEGRYYLDGGLLESRHVAVKGAIVIWDVLIRAGKNMVGTRYIDRYNWLQKFIHPAHTYSHNGVILGPCFTDNIFLPVNYQPQDWERAWSEVETLNKPYPKPFLEGLFFKNPIGVLKPGLAEKNNADWLGRSRVCTGRHRF